MGREIRRTRTRTRNGKRRTGNEESLKREIFKNSKSSKMATSFIVSSLEYSSSSTLAGLSYHICGKLEVAFRGSPSSQHQHCTDEAQKAETVLSAVIYIYMYLSQINQ